MESKTIEKKRCTAIILAAGSGSRMQSDIPKQYMPLCGKPLIWYALNAVQESEIIDDCILVTAESDIPYMRDEIVKKYNFSKVDAIVEGGAERYLSVANAMRVIASPNRAVPNEDGYVFIHDGARPFLTEKILRDTYEAVCEYHACVAAVPSKDTIKIVDGQGYVSGTPERKYVWSIQTPQVFDTILILQAYERLMNRLPQMEQNGITVTDDASVVELFTNQRVKLVEASYENIKITTPEDIKTAEAFLGN
ncbi:MAG: 2-C-methyl-D-erythritol 4-phosphate cytidylyltransferase [Lachnospiraceae bacterium]|nr:2-C-methyl-D-erythritol 4-phosphate cytidylyltransferase [Lachnospiraceae bacterium]